MYYVCHKHMHMVQHLKFTKGSYPLTPNFIIYAYPTTQYNGNKNQENSYKKHTNVYMTCLFKNIDYWGFPEASL